MTVKSVFMRPQGLSLGMRAPLAPILATLLAIAIPKCHQINKTKAIKFRRNQSQMTIIALANQRHVETHVRKRLTIRASASKPEDRFRFHIPDFNMERLNYIRSQIKPACRWFLVRVAFPIKRKWQKALHY